jgi:EmrB/QacA subfamily drug resistance transporter
MKAVAVNTTYRIKIVRSMVSGSACPAARVTVEKERAHQIGTLAITCLGLFVVLLDTTIVNNALPPIGASLGASLAGLAWVVDSYILPFAVLLLLAGTLSDRFGRKRMFGWGLVVFSLGAVLCAVAPGLLWLEIGQAVCGASGAAIATGGMSLLVAAFPDPRERTQAVGAYAALGGIALSAGPLVGGVLVDGLGWRWMFIVNIPVCLVALLLGALVLRESRNPSAQRVDVLGQVTSIGGLTLLTYALIEANSRGWSSPLIVGCLGGAAVLLVAFIAVQARSAEPMMPLQLFAKPAFSMANLTIAVVGFAMIGTTFFFAQYFQTIRGYTAFASGLATLPATIGLCFCAPISTRMASRWGFRTPVVLGAVVGGGGLLTLRALGPATPFAEIWWRLALFGVGFGLMLAPLAAVVVTSVPPWRAGLASAINTTARQLGAVLGVAVLGTVVSHSFASGIADRLAALHLPPAVTETLTTQLTERSSAPPPATAPPAVVAAIRTAAGTAFTDALHTAFTLAGVAVLLLAVPCWLTLRAHPAPATPIPETVPAMPKPLPPFPDAARPWYGHVAPQPLFDPQRPIRPSTAFNWFRDPAEEAALPD